MIPNQSDNSLSNSGTSSSSIVVKLALSWALVGIPLGWGVWQVFKKSLDLFR